MGLAKSSCIAFLLVAFAACTRTSSEKEYADQIFSNKCEAFEAIAKLALGYHLTKDESYFPTLRSDALKKAMGKSKITGFDAQDTSCTSLETFLDQQATEHAAFDKNAFYYDLLEEFISNLDPHSRYYSPETSKEYREYMQNNKKGFGITFQLRARDYYLPIKNLKIDEVVSKEAKDRQLEPGDGIVSIDGVNISGEVLTTISKKFNSESTIKLEVDTKGEVSLSKSQYNLAPVYFSDLVTNNGKFLHIKVRDFHDGLNAYFESKFSRYHLNDYEGILLDLRTNPGGSLQEAIDFIGFWSDENVVVDTQGPQNKPKVLEEFSLNKSYVIKGKNRAKHKPTAILIDSLTASAAEVMSGALKNTKAVLTGHRSFGKATGQQILKLSAKNGFGGTLVLTMFRYFFNKRESPQLYGLAPEITFVDKEFESYVSQQRAEKKEIIFQEQDYGTYAISWDGLSADQKSLDQKVECDYSQPQDCEVLTSANILNKLDAADYFN